MSATGQDDFSARLARIRERGSQATIMVGQDEQYLIARKQHVSVPRHQEIAGNLLYPASLFGAILLGMVAVALSHYVRFHLMTESALLVDPGSEMLLIGAIGFAASFVLSQAFKLTSKEHRSLQGIGVFLMVCTFHNLPHWMPGPMSLAFSPAYVATTVETSPRNSIRLGGNYVELFETPAVSSEVQDTPMATSAEPQAEPSTEAQSPVKPKVRKGGKIVEGG